MEDEHNYENQEVSNIKRKFIPFSVKRENFIKFLKHEHNSCMDHNTDIEKGKR